MKNRIGQLSGSHLPMEDLLRLVQTGQADPGKRRHLRTCPECEAEYARLRTALSPEPDPLPAPPPALAPIRPSLASVARFLGTFFGARAGSNQTFVAAHPRFCAFLGLEPGLNLAQCCIEDSDI